MLALLVLLLAIALLGGFGFTAHFLWVVLLVVLVLWLLGWAGTAPVDGGRRRWYGRW